MKPIHTASAALALGIASLLLTPLARSAEAPPLQVSGIYPHLAMYNTSGECGIGAVVPWAGKIWVITYPPHFRNGSDDKLYEIDPATMAVVARPESVGGTHANRMIHRESNQLVIGAYFIDSKGNVRAADVKKALVGRMTATSRHLTDPANKVLFFDMEGPILETDVKSLETKKIFTKPAPGWHGKGAYTSQGVYVIANNGENSAGDFAKKGEFPLDKWSKGPEEAGVLAEWNGKEWSVILRRQFTEVTGPGGIEGAPADQPDAPIWATGWDKRSVILAVRDAKNSPDKPWKFFRMPKASHTFDPSHGWFTEWPRIREIAPGRLMMVMHGMMYDFPKGFSHTAVGGIRPIASHLRYIPDFCSLGDGKIILAADDCSVMANPLAGISQSNLWFGTVEQLKEFGPAAGWGGVWLADAIKADQPSDPYLFAGFAQRVLHIAHKGSAEVKFTIEVDAAGDGKWATYRTLAIPAHGYAFHIFPADVKGEWIRLKADKDCEATAYLEYLTPLKPERSPIFASLAPAGVKSTWSGGILRPGKDKSLQFISRTVDAQGNAGSAVYYEIDENLAFKKVEDAKKVEEVLKLNEIKADHRVDEASVIIGTKGAKGEVRFRLPRGPEGFNAIKEARGRGIREVQSERNLANFDGTFYEIPRGNLRQIKPVASHPFAISDFCTWRGMLVLAGNLADAKPDGHFFKAADSGVGLWFGKVDDLWRLGKPVGRGGPWKNTAVKADEPSDAYLMTNYDKKRVELSHDSAQPVNMTIKVDPTNTGLWCVYQTIAVAPGQTVTHAFPEGYNAYWVRVVADKACKATATFIYE